MGALSRLPPQPPLKLPRGVHMHMRRVTDLRRLAPGPVWDGMRVGLYGGSFDPPHSGHAHVAQTALRRLNLDQVWVMVSPQNPLKSRRPADYAARLSAARARLSAPRIHVSDFEARIAAAYTIQTLDALRAAFPHIRFTLIMGADSLASLHHWRDWKRLTDSVAVAVVPRPGWALRARVSPAARRRGVRFLNAATDPASSTDIRAALARGD